MKRYGPPVIVSRPSLGESWFAASNQMAGPVGWREPQLNQMLYCMVQMTQTSVFLLYHAARRSEKGITGFMLA